VTAFYLDSSVAVRVLLGHSPAAIRWFAATVAGPHPVLSSRLLGTELTRVLRREQLGLERRDEILDHLATISMTPPVFRAADAIEDRIKTLDALHLASALMIDDDNVTVVTHNATVARAARSVGLDVHDPVTDDPGRPAIG